MAVTARTGGGALTSAQVTEMERWARALAANGGDESLRQGAQAVVKLAREAERLRLDGDADGWEWADPEPELGPGELQALIRSGERVAGGSTADHQAVARAIAPARARDRRPPYRRAVRVGAPTRRGAAGGLGAAGAVSSSQPCRGRSCHRPRRPVRRPESGSARPRARRPSRRRPARAGGSGEAPALGRERRGNRPLARRREGRQRPGAGLRRAFAAHTGVPCRRRAPDRGSRRRRPAMGLRRHQLARHGRRHPSGAGAPRRRPPGAGAHGLRAERARPWSDGRRRGRARDPRRAGRALRVRLPFPADRAGRDHRAGRRRQHRHPCGHRPPRAAAAEQPREGRPRVGRRLGERGAPRGRASADRREAHQRGRARPQGRIGNHRLERPGAVRPRDRRGPGDLRPGGRGRAAARQRCASDRASRRLPRPHSGRGVLEGGPEGPGHPDARREAILRRLRWLHELRQPGGQAVQHRRRRRGCPARRGRHPLRLRAPSRRPARQHAVPGPGGRGLRLDRRFPRRDRGRRSSRPGPSSARPSSVSPRRAPTTSRRTSGPWRESSTTSPRCSTRRTGAPASTAWQARTTSRTRSSGARWRTSRTRPTAQALASSRGCRTSRSAPSTARPR